ncbi:MAG: glycosyltransferase [bacterium]|nr:glycosyltransferase [Patescibacteria group bacterium]
MRIALVHDYLSQDGGAERVLKAMHEIWPEAPIFVLFHDKEKIDYFPLENIRESFIAKLPFFKTHFQWYLPLMPLATEKYNLDGFDLVLSSTSAFAKGVIVQPETLHISYCHTPPRYLWTDANEYVAELNYGGIVKKFLPFIIHKLRIWDRLSADRVDYFLANSETVRKRIKKYYRRDSQVINPPVDTKKFSVSRDIGDYFVAGGRLVPYKKLDIVIKAFNRLNWPLKIFGTGPELKYLREISKSNIQFLGKISEEEKASLLNRARAFIHPQIEDFGITPIESMASGRPVIAYSAGGAGETIVSGETGVFIKEQTWESLLNAVLKFDHTAWDCDRIRESALRFDANVFKTKIKNLIEEKYNAFKQGII